MAGKKSKLLLSLLFYGLLLGTGLVYISRPLDNKTNEKQNGVENNKNGHAHRITPKLKKANSAAKYVQWAPAIETKYIKRLNYEETLYPRSFRNDGQGSLSTRPMVSFFYSTEAPAPKDIRNYLSSLERNPKNIKVLENVVRYLANANYRARTIPYMDRFLAAGGNIDSLLYKRHLMNQYIIGLSLVNRRKEAKKLYYRYKKKWAGSSALFGMSSYIAYFSFYTSWLVDRDFKSMVGDFEFGVINGLRSDHYYWLYLMIRESIRRAANAGKLEQIFPVMEKAWVCLPHSVALQTKGYVINAGYFPPKSLVDACDPLNGGQVTHPHIMAQRAIHSLDNLHNTKIALAQAERAVELAIPIGDDQHYWTLVYLARVLRQSGDIERAYDVTMKCKAIAEKLGGAEYIARVNMMIGYLHIWLGDYRKAITIYDSIIQTGKEQFNSYIYGQPEMARLRALARMGKAEFQLRNTASYYYDNNYISEIGHSSLALGICLNRQEKYDEAVRILSKTEERAKSLGWKTYKVEISTQVDILIELGRAYLGKKDYDNALKIFTKAGKLSRKTQETGFWWYWQYGMALANYGLKNSEQAQVWIDKAIHSIETQRASLKDYHRRRTLYDNKFQVFELAVQLALDKKKYHDAFHLIERVRARAFLDALGKKGSKNKIPTPATLKKVRNNTSFTTISFFQMENKLLAWIIRKNVKLIIIPISKKQSEEAVQNFRNSIILNDHQAKKHSQKLYKMIWKYLEKNMQKEKTICIIPHQSLHYLPFQVLHNGQKFLVEKHNIYYSPSVSSLIFLKGKKLAGYSKITVFEVLLAKNRNAPFGKTETLAIKKLYPKVRIFLRERATIKAFQKYADQANIIHMSAHGFFDPWIPVRSGLVMKKNIMEEELLRAQEIYEMKFDKTSLMVMSSCVSSVGDLAGGDEVTGLTRAFQVAGIPNVIGSLWSVGNEPTTELMTRFYTILKKRSNPVIALCSSQRQMINKGSRIFDWAGFQVTGQGK